MIVALVVAASYGALALGSVPGLRMNRATIAISSTAALIGLGAISLSQAWLAINPDTIVFLLSMMLLNAYLSYAGCLRWALVALVRLGRSPLGVLVWLTGASGLLSAFLLNDTLALVCTPLTIAIAKTLRLKPVPYVLAVAAATNIGSVATLSGNPQNILVGTFSGIGYLRFAAVLTPVAVVGLVVQVLWLLWLYPEVRSRTPCAFDLPTVKLYQPLFRKTMIVTAGLISAFVVGLPLAESALVAAALLLVTRRIKPERVLQSVDGSLLVVFAGLFVLTAVVRSLTATWTPPLTSAGGIFVAVVLLSNVISNVPAVLLLQTWVSDERTWLLLAAGATLAGNLTLFGSVANLITAEAVKAAGQSLSFGEHLRFGLPLTLVLLLLTYGWVLQVS